jgi:ferredoxin
MVKKKIVITFPHQLVEKPITYHLVKDYDLVVNIMKARVMPNEEGLLVVELTGKKENLEKGIKYLKGIGVNIQALANDIKWDKKKCIHCTECVGICPTKALSVDRKTMKVTFDKKKCIACGLCVDVCPYHAIEIIL